ALGRPRAPHDLRRSLGGLRAVLRPALLAAGHAGGVERAANDVVADAWKIFHTAAPNHHDRVLLEIVADARDVGRGLQAVGEPHAGHLAQGRIRLLRRRRVDADADAAFLRARLHRRRLRLLPHGLTTLAHELINGRHVSPDAEPLGSSDKTLTL